MASLIFERCVSKVINPSFFNCTRHLKILSSLSQEKILRYEDSQQVQIPDYADFSLCSAWESKDEEIKAIKFGLIRDMTVLPNFINKEEEKSFMTELEPYLKKMRYEFDHWDDAIHGFKETERSQWKDSAASAVERAKGRAISPPDVPLPLTHVLDLDVKGYIKPHVDAVRVILITLDSLMYYPEQFFNDGLPDTRGHLMFFLPQ